jgi:hypothetical protein
MDLQLAGRTGAAQVTATVGVAGYKNKEINLLLRANVLPRVRTEPRRHGFGEVRAGAGGRADVVLIARAANVTLTEVECDSPYFLAKPGRPTTTNTNGREETRIPVQLELLPSAPVGWQSGKVRFVTSIGDSVETDVSADVQGSLKVEPPDVGRGTISVGQETSRTFALLSRDGELVEINGVSLVLAEKLNRTIDGIPYVGIADSRVKLTSQAEGHKVAVEVVFKAPAAPGAYQVQARFTGKGGPDDVLVVPIYFDVEP